MGPAKLRINTKWLICVIAGAVASIAISGILTILISVAICLGAHPEAAMAAEWAAAAMGVVWAGGLVSRAGIVTSTATGALVGFLWALSWLYLVGRWDTHLWITEALPAVTWHHVLAWTLAPALGALGGLLGKRLRWRRGLALHIAMPAVVILVVFANHFSVAKPGTYEIAEGVRLTIENPDKDGTSARLFTLNFAKNKALSPGIYDQDMHDSHPFDDQNSSYLGTPSPTVFDRLGDDSLLLFNAGFFTWDKRRIASHVAPILVDGQAHYDVGNTSEMWTFGWKSIKGVPEFRLRRGITFKNLPNNFDYAFSMARPLIIDGRPQELKPGPGVTRLKCSRISMAWSDPRILHILVVCDPDGEMASIKKWKRKEKQVGGWDLLQLQNFWAQKGMANALILDGGDSTELVYRGPNGTATVSSARFSQTLTYIHDRPLRVWMSILPVRHSNVGICNYIYVKCKR